MKLLLVTGTFDDKEGKASHFGNVLRDKAEGYKIDVTHYNGGHLTDFNAIMNDMHTFGSILWMPNVDNSVEKMLPVIKNLAPKAILISSKRVIEKMYDEFAIVGRLLKTHSNLGLVVSKEDKDYKFSLLDPLGNRWCDKVSLEDAADVLFERLKKIKTYRRVGSESIGPRKSIEMSKDFLEIVKSYGEQFDQLIRAVHKERFLGNASTRCMHGFPAARSNENILISRRNIDKTIISEEGFVEVKTDPSIVKYYGDDKPSVDTPVQIRLFDYYPKVNYIVHGHVYIKDAPTTARNIPCGYIEEFDEITNIFENKDCSNFAVNLRGHGCILLAESLEWLKSSKDNLVFRPFPEDSQW